MAVAAYIQDTDVEYAELNYIYTFAKTPDDPNYQPEQWALNNDACEFPVPGGGSERGTAGCDMNAPEAWDITTGDSNVVVAVIDSGVDYDHNDLAANMWTDANGFHGYDFFSEDNYPMDEYGHGTHCAGIIAADGNNTTDIAGICWTAKIMAVKLSGTSINFPTTPILRGVVYAVDNGADVLSCSWGSYDLNAVKEVIDYAQSQGAVVVAAAGNDNSDSPQYPAAYDNVIAVAATDANDNRTYFTNYGDWIHVAAPGANIVSLHAAGTDLCEDGDHYYPHSDANAPMYICSGTSMACPHVAGLAGLCLAEEPNLTPGDVMLLLRFNSDDVGDPNLGYGRINAHKTLSAIDPNFPDPNKATEPDPCHHANSVSINTYLTWTPDDLASSHDVYLGTDFNDVNDANTSSGVFQGNVLIALFDPAALDQNTTYHWRIDERNFSGSAKGDVWDFTTRDGTIIYVDDDANDGGDGMSWATAFNKLEDAFDITVNDEIWVAAGTYAPDTNDRSKGFAPPEDTKLYGGFAGTETSRGARDANLALNVSTLSGDINVPNDANDNCYHVISGSDNLVLDRFTVTAGNADGSGLNDRGAGMYNYDTLYISVTDCTFTQNVASLFGGALYNWRAIVTIGNCTFSNNKAVCGGAIRSDDSLTTLTNSTITENEVTASGGGFAALTSFDIIRNSQFTNNTAAHYGGGVMAGWYGHGAIENCTFSGNEAQNQRGGGLAVISNTSTDVTNCVFWDNQANDSNEVYTNASVTLSYCDIRDAYDANGVWDSNLGSDGGGNIDQDPCFVDDDANDFHIGPNSPCIDAGDPNGYYGGQTDIDGEPRVQGTYVDMGADEARRVHNVDKDKWYVTIQAAIDDSNDGNDIVVYAGTYEETVDYNGKAVTVRSTDPNDANVVAATIIDADGATSAVCFNSSEDANSILNALTLKNATFGIYCSAFSTASPTVTNCVIKDNATGMYYYSGDPTISNCTVVNNNYGINCTTGNGTIENCLIEGNGAAGIYTCGATTIRYNEIRGSTYLGISLRMSSATVKSNWIYDNGSYGVRSANSPSAVLRNNTIVGNTSAGIYKYSGTQPTISNCIVWDCNDDLYGCTATYSCISDCNDANGVGNICGDANDPNFVDPNNDDYHLTSGSPCIDTGDPNGTYTGELDIDLEDRVMGDYVDMGGDERDPNS